MKKVLSLSVFFALLSLRLTAQTIVGGAGVCHVDQDPDNITAMQTQDERGDCLVAWDNTNQALYVYDAGQTLGNRWIAVPLATVTDTDTRLDNPVINAGNLQFDIYDVINTSVIGTVTIPVLSIAPTQSVAAGTGISVNTVAGVATVTNTAPDQTVSITNGGGITPSGTYPNFTLTAADQSATNEAQNLTSALTGGNDVEITLGQAGGAGGGVVSLEEGDGVDLVEVSAGNYSINSTQFAATVADSHADAGTNGVAIGEFFYASITNEMGVTPGTKIRRMY